MDCLMGTFNPGTNNYNQGLGGLDTSGQMGIPQLDALFHAKSDGKSHTEMDELGVPGLRNLQSDKVQLSGCRSKYLVYTKL